MRLPPEAYITAHAIVPALFRVALNWSDKDWDGWNDATNPRPYGVAESGWWLEFFDREHTMPFGLYREEFHVGNLGPKAVINRMDRIIELTQGG